MHRSRIPPRARAPRHRAVPAARADAPEKSADVSSARSRYSTPAATARRTKCSSTSARSQCVSDSASSGLAATSSRSESSPRSAKRSPGMMAVVREPALEPAPQLGQMRQPSSVRREVVAVGQPVACRQPLQRQVGQRSRGLADREARVRPALEQHDVVAEHREHARQQRSGEPAPDDRHLARSRHAGTPAVIATNAAVLRHPERAQRVEGSARCTRRTRSPAPLVRRD